VSFFDYTSREVPCGSISCNGASGPKRTVRARLFFHLRTTHPVTAVDARIAGSFAKSVSMSSMPQALATQSLRILTHGPSKNPASITNCIGMWLVDWPCYGG
jgi:hypothetical protein